MGSTAAASTPGNRHNKPIRHRGRRSTESPVRATAAWLYRGRRTLNTCTVGGKSSRRRVQMINLSQRSGPFLEPKNSGRLFVFNTAAAVRIQYRRRDVNRVVLFAGRRALARPRPESMLGAGGLTALQAMLATGSSARATRRFPPRPASRTSLFSPAALLADATFPRSAGSIAVAYPGHGGETAGGPQLLRLPGPPAGCRHRSGRAHHLRAGAGQIGIFTPVAKGLTPDRDPSRCERQLCPRRQLRHGGTSRRIMPSPGTCSARSEGSAAIRVRPVPGR